MEKFKGVIQISTISKDIVSLNFDNEESYNEVLEPIKAIIENIEGLNFITIDRTIYGRDFLKGCSIFYRSWQ